MPRKQIAHTTNDPTIDFTPLVIDGESYRLAFSFNSICLAERATGLNLLHAIQTQSLDSNQFRAIFFAALAVAHPSMTVEKAGNIIGFDTISLITEKISACWTASMAPAKKEESAEAE